MFTMKVFMSAKKQNNQRSQKAVVSSTPSSNSNSKMLWRLPHVFDNVLELPFHSDTDVSIEETPQFLRFIALCNNNMNTFNTNAGGVRAHAIEIIPGITKIVIVGMNGGDVKLAGQHLRFAIDQWRFRLPASSLPEMATAVCSGGKLVVTVPKSKGN